MNAKEVKNVLINNNVYELFHANSVLTSLTFLNNGGLLSRGTVEDLNLPQTSQQSDEIDKKFNIYYDIFFDSVDIHQRAKRKNDYGPVTFVYSVNVLDSIGNYDVCVTKYNPQNYENNTTNKELYFTNYEDLNSNFTKGDFAQQITIRKIREALSFEYLKEIIIDYPGTSREKYFTSAYDALEKALKENEINVSLVRRNCPSECKCQEQYSNFKERYTYHRFKIE